MRVRVNASVRVCVRASVRVSACVSERVRECVQYGATYRVIGMDDRDAILRTLFPHLMCHSKDGQVCATGERSKYNALPT